MQSILMILFTDILWLLHGVFIFDLSLIVSCCICTVINMSLVMLYVIYMEKKEKMKPAPSFR
jgi:hypothetical protein